MKKSSWIKAAMILASSTTLIIAACLFSPTVRCQAQDASPTQPEVHTYYMFIFSNPVAGKEEEYNKWYSEQHAPDVVSVPGFVSAQRYVISDLQLRPDASAPKGVRYMVMYKIVTSDLTAVYGEVRKRAMNGTTRMSTTLDGSTIFGFTYEALAPARQGAAPRGAGKDQVEALPHYLQVVLSDPTTETEAEYNSWYNAHHVPEMLAVPGFISGQRCKFSEVQLNKDSAPKYLALFTIATPDLKTTLDEFHRLAPKMTDSPAFKSSHTAGYTFKAIGPMLDGNAVRASRARRE